jgi:hypothetical protein
MKDPSSKEHHQPRVELLSAKQKSKYKRKGANPYITLTSQRDKSFETHWGTYLVFLIRQAIYHSHGKNSVPECVKRMGLHCLSGIPCCWGCGVFGIAGGTKLKNASFVVARGNL